MSKIQILRSHPNFSLLHVPPLDLGTQIFSEKSNYLRVILMQNLVSGKTYEKKWVSLFKEGLGSIFSSLITSVKKQPPSRLTINKNSH